MSFVTNVTVFEGPPGCGKTTRFLDEMSQTAGRYLFAMPRNRLIDERVQDLRRTAAAAGTDPLIVPIHSDQRKSASIRQRVREAGTELSSQAHCIVMITHEALITADLSRYAGWQARVDEVPDAVASGSLTLPASWSVLASAFDLVPVEGTRWSQVVIRNDAFSMRDLMRDDLVGDLATFYKRARGSQGVYVDRQAWSEARDRQAVNWWSAWSPVELAHFETTQIAAANYFDSLCHLATSRRCGDTVEYTTEVVGTGRTGNPKVRVHYYTRHEGTTNFWESSVGEECLSKVGRHLATVGVGYWSGNKDVQKLFKLLVPGRVTPKQAGTNEYRDCTSCAFIYSNKAQDADAPIMEAFGLSKDDIRRARQDEDIKQFVMRGSIRCPEFNGRYDIYVYDLAQAEVVRDYLAENGISDVELIGLDAVGIMDVERPVRGRKAEATTPDAIAERQEVRREKDRLRKQDARAKERVAKAVAGELRRRGRPRKQAA
jgi:hypothetical protein